MIAKKIIKIAQTGVHDAAQLGSGDHTTRHPVRPPQLAAFFSSNVACWHETDMPKYLGDVRCWVNSGKHMLAWSFSGFDPYRKSRLLTNCRCHVAKYWGRK